MIMNPRRNVTAKIHEHQAFSLVELVIVVTMIGIIATDTQLDDMGIVDIQRQRNVMDQ